MPATVPGVPTASGPAVLRPGTTLPCLSRYMSRVAPAGAVSRKSSEPAEPLRSR